MAFKKWRFNLRKSNTEPLVRLNIESNSSSVSVLQKLKEISQHLSAHEF